MNLILTIGAGTGKAPTLLEGMLATLNALKPERYWLVPSSSPDSVTTADLIREEHPAGFQPWSDSHPYRAIEQHDDLFDCRSAIREVIARARQFKGELQINPTSGTKQMSAGATLAALDEEIGEIVFTVGERREGIVVSGTEQMAGFSTGEFFREKALREANILYQSGAFHAAGQLLKKWKGDPAVDKAILIARCAHDWHRLNYRDAAGAAARFDAKISEHLNKLARAVENNDPSKTVLGDLLASADDLRRWGDAEEAATRSYKAMEYAIRMVLCRALNIRPPFKQEYFKDVPLKEPPTIPPGLRQMMVILQAIQDPFAEEYNQLREPLRIRNEAMHDIRPVNPGEAQSLCDRIWNAIQRHFPDISRTRNVTLPSSLL